MAVWQPPKHIDLEKLREAMEENEKIKDAHEVGYREGFKKGIDRKPMAERRESLVRAIAPTQFHGASPGLWMEIAGDCVTIADLIIAALDGKEGGEK